LIDRLKSNHSVQAVGVVNALPLSKSESLSTLFVEGYPNTKPQVVEGRGITQGYLSAMQTPLIEGRDISDDDAAEHRLVAVVKQAFAEKYFANKGADRPPHPRRRGRKRALDYGGWSCKGCSVHEP
jgi:hypothetical protein